MTEMDTSETIYNEPGRTASPILLITFTDQERLCGLAHKFEISIGNSHEDDGTPQISIAMGRENIGLYVPMNLEEAEQYVQGLQNAIVGLKRAIQEHQASRDGG